MTNIAKEKYMIVRDRRDPLNPVYWNLVSRTLAVIEKIYGVRLPEEWLVLYPDGRSLDIVLAESWHRVAEVISEKLLNNKRFFEKLQKICKLKAKNIKKFFKEIKKKDISKLEFKELISLANKIKKVWLDFDTINMPAWFVGGDQFKEKVGRLLDLSQDDFLFLTTPTEKTEVGKLECDLLKYTKLIKKNKKSLEKIAEKLSEKYGWIPCGYEGIEYWGKDYFIGKLKENIKNHSEKVDEEIKLIGQSDRKNLEKRNQIIKKYKINKCQLDLLDKINTLAIWTDERKKLEFSLHHYYALILLELGKRHDIPYKNLKYLFTKELSNIEKDRDNLMKISNKRAAIKFMFKCRGEKIIIISKKKKNEILREIEKQIKQTKLIAGVIASKGTKNIYQGTAKILLSPKQGDKVKSGDFLVATMTSPDYILSMKRAAGFITDEGGVTCHAAIISREMNKPCIIGTKIATKVLKDGQLVEVDANKGVVKIIK